MYVCSKDADAVEISMLDENRLDAVGWNEYVARMWTLLKSATWVKRETRIFVWWVGKRI